MRWKWEPISEGEKVGDLWDALNRIIHAKKLHVGFEQLPDCVTVIDGGATVANVHGHDVTDEYVLGAHRALRTARQNGITVALLKARSPSCGR